MAITREKKENIIEKVKDAATRAKSFVFVQFHGLSVADAQALRRSFRENDAEYVVVKKTLLKKALKDSGKEFDSELEGEIGVAFSYGDELAAFKTASDFTKKLKEKLQIAGGYFEDKFVDISEARMLGSIPGREALIGQVMSVLQGNIRKFMYVVNELSKKGETN